MTMNAIASRTTRCGTVITISSSLFLTRAAVRPLMNARRRGTFFASEFFSSLKSAVIVFPPAVNSIEVIENGYTPPSFLTRQKWMPMKSTAETGKMKQWRT